MEKILRWFRSCPLCSSMVVPVDGVCSFCFSQLMKRAPRELHPHPGKFLSLSLFDWTEDFENAGALVKALKGPYHQRAYQNFAVEFLRRLPGRVAADTVIVVPPSKKDKPDHAFNFGRALGEILALPVEKPFIVDSKTKIETEVAQKKLNRVERLKLEFKLVKRPKAESYIFADDVITTGATARAAWKALGKPKAFQAWSLVYRPFETF